MRSIIQGSSLHVRGYMHANCPSMCIAGEIGAFTGTKCSLPHVFGTAIVAEKVFVCDFRGGRDVF